MGVGFTPDDDLLAMLINLQDNTGDSFILAFHLISIVLLISANSEILDRHTDPVFPCQFGVGCETMEFEELVVQIPFFIGIWEALRIVVPILCVSALLLVAIRIWRRRRAR